MLKHKVLLIIIFCVSLFSCTKKPSKPIVIWTDHSEIASYVEMFNAGQKECKAIIIYKENLALSLPPAKGEIKPDVVIGAWLKNADTRRNFMPINYLFHNVNIKKNKFYPALLEIGRSGLNQYLLPLSFNLPAVLFSKRNEGLLPNSYVISLDEMREISVKTNVKNKRGIFTYMGFSPRWSSKFLYTASKMKGADFRESSKIFTWNAENLNSAVEYLKGWSVSNNESSEIEEDYAFKYLYMPEYKWISQNRCLFAFTTSDQFFSLPEEKVAGIDYRWLHNNKKTPIEDNVVLLGLYRHSKNTKNAENFIVWLMKEETQKEILERNMKMKLNTATFGIAGGFSSIRSINEKVFTEYNPNLMKNLPIAEYLAPVNVLPARWKEIKENVVYPYIKDSTSTLASENQYSLEERIRQWNKRYY